MYLHIALLLLIQILTTAFGCPTGWENFENKKCFSYHPVAKIFDEAKELCSELHASLASIRSYEEQEFLELLAKRHTRLSGVHWAWIGATRTHHSDGTNFTWPDGSPLNYTKWRSGCPDSREDENCVLMTVFKDRSSHWCNFKCDSNHDHVICERPYPEVVAEVSTSTTTVKTISVIGSGGNRGGQGVGTPPSRRVSTEKTIELYDTACPLGWSHYQSKCYILHDANVTFTEAPHVCKHRYGGKMVSIHSEEEQIFLTDNLFFVNGAAEAVWLGGKREKDNSTVWGWLDKTPFDYKNWGYNEPDNRHIAGPENCIVLNDIKPNFGMWIDVPCHMEFLLICEKPAKLNTTSGSKSSMFERIEALNDESILVATSSRPAGHTGLVMIIISLLFIIAMMSIVIYMLQQKLKRSHHYCSTLNFSNASYDASRNLVTSAEPPFAEDNYAEITYGQGFRQAKDPFSA